MIDKDNDVFFSADLTSLPPSSPSSALKKLIAERCGIKSLPENLFHHHLEEVDLSGNTGKEIGNGWLTLHKILPRK